MYKKSIQNILLVGSVLTAFILVYQIWFSGYFLSDGYEYLTSGLYSKIVQPILQFLGHSNDRDFSENIQMLFKPEKIVLNASSDRVILTEEEASFNETRGLSREVIRGCMVGDYPVKSKEIVDMDTYFSVLKGRSIYVDYGKDCDYRLFSQGICGKEKNTFTDDISVIQSYIISLHDGLLNDVSIYIADQKSNHAYRYVVEADKSRLEKQLSNLMRQTYTGSSPSYSFELNFHKVQDQRISKVLFDPLILSDLTPVSLPPVRIDEGETLDNMFHGRLTESILDMFSINSQTMRKYTDLDNARVFVENNATLTLRENGLLEYQAVQGGRGLDITKGDRRANYDIYAATTHAVDFVAELCGQISPEFFDHLQISTNLTENAKNQGLYRICFDYYVQGIPIRHKTADGYAYTIEMEIADGYLQSYNQFTKNYKITDGEIRTLPPMLNAADMLVDSLYDGENPLYINKIGVCYAENEQNIITPQWHAIVDGIDRMIATDEEDDI
ncbi:MAG: hypothetical protein E7393_01145 [Ruminococcaceae bacterium]|nr:hypothetical protein [Oscillospiraceae bacterium]